LRVGGRSETTKRYEGIHWHVSDRAQVRYEVLDRERTKIGKISVFDQGKLVAEYEAPKANRNLPVLDVRTMDCVDCHNRPTHVFDSRPSDAVDRAMSEGLLDRKVPYLAGAAAQALRTPDVPREGAAARLQAALADIYRTSHPDVKLPPAALEQAGRTLADLYARNVYPQMKIGWGTHKNHLGHGGDPDAERDPGEADAQPVGCFRCHDLEHERKLPNGKTEAMSQDCELCHEAIGRGEDPAKLDEKIRQLLPR
jgi:hypothetical protein